MYVSMTGFSRTAIEREWGTVTLELSSVNHRYQEIYVRLPREFSSWEPWFHQRMRSLYRRGKAQLRVDIEWNASSEAVSLNKSVLARYCVEISGVRDSLGALGAKCEISLDALVNLPGVLDTQGRTGIGRDDATEALLSELLDLGVGRWNEMRRSEGDHLREAIAVHLEALSRHMSDIERAWPGARDAAFRAMVDRVGSALEASGAALPDESRLAQEVIILADRWDVSEEISRMASHIAKFREAGESREPEGRKLDFIVQEMNREANTINSKVSNAEIRWMAVEAKAAIERIREQIQNLE
ncbi:MAG: YicC family protein [Synergistaceae bacterium]|jgi:uncharacterized protein (TIGR00255 family)|nr:YicC family protein [Synergistaceae bacterium]